MAVLMMVVGLITAPLLHMYHVTQSESRAGASNNSLIAIDKAISDFYYENFRYPCPARMTATPSDSDFGIEEYVEGTGCTGTAVSNTFSGAVPFVTLKIPMKLSIDGWDNKIRYVVARQMTVGPVLTAPSTSIILQSFKEKEDNRQCPGTRDDDRTNILFVLVSHGQDGMGAHSVEGRQIQGCPSGGGAPLDAENCNGDTTFFANVCARSTPTGINHYDDIVLANDRIRGKTWNYSTSATADPTDIVSTVSQVVINANEAFGGTDISGVDVHGNIRSDGNIVTDNICDQNGGNCFNPNLIAGPPDGQNNCGSTANRGMRGIWNGTEAGDSRLGARVRCQNSFLSTAQRDCSPRSAIGFAGGRILCAP